MMQQPISAIILAGGQGRRMGYQDKGLISWQGKPLIEHVINRIAPQVTDIIVSCNQHQQQYRQYGYTLVEDSFKNFQGPLAGISASLPFIQNEYCLICPCDTPKLPPSLVERLLKELTLNDADIVYPVAGKRQHYVPALINTRIEGSLKHYLATEQRSIHGWYKQLRTCCIDFDENPQAFLNINSIELLTNSS